MTTGGESISRDQETAKSAVLWKKQRSANTDVCNLAVISQRSLNTDSKVMVGGHRANQQMSYPELVGCASPAVGAFKLEVSGPRAPLSWQLREVSDKAQSARLLEIDFNLELLANHYLLILQKCGNP